MNKIYKFWLSGCKLFVKTCILSFGIGVFSIPIYLIIHFSNTEYLKNITPYPDILRGIIILFCYLILFPITYQYASQATSLTIVYKKK